MDCPTGKIPWTAYAAIQQASYGVKRPYRCPICGAWHLGSDSLRRGPRSKKAYRDAKNPPPMMEDE